MERGVLTKGLFNYTSCLPQFLSCEAVLEFSEGRDRPSRPFATDAGSVYVRLRQRARPGNRALPPLGQIEARPAKSLCRFRPGAQDLAQPSRCFELLCCGRKTS